LVPIDMTDQRQFTLRQVDQNRNDFATIKTDLQFIMGQLARMPTRKELARTALGIIFATAAIVILWAEAFWHL
jgi:hypothetical protein